jgi:tetratricopeptide (TPR) repeat protein
MRAVFVCLLLVSAARADEDPDTEVARKHFNTGRAYYDNGEYDKALSEFEGARRVRPHPALDYNIGRCLDRLERYQDAINAYDRYAATNPPDAAEIRTRIEQLKERLRLQPPKPPPPREREVVMLLPPSLESAPPPPKKDKRTVAIVLGVLGGAVVVGGAIAIGLLVKTNHEAPWPDSTGGPHPATQ